MENLWPDQDVQLVRDDEETETFSCERFTFTTIMEGIINLYPAESAYRSIAYALGMLSTSLHTYIYPLSHLTRTK